MAERWHIMLPSAGFDLIVSAAGTDQEGGRLPDPTANIFSHFLKVAKLSITKAVCLYSCFFRGLEKLVGTEIVLRLY